MHFVHVPNLTVLSRSQLITHQHMNLNKTMSMHFVHVPNRSSIYQCSRHQAHKKAQQHDDIRSHRQLSEPKTTK